LRAVVRGRPLRDLAAEVLALAEAGLKARARPGAGGMIGDETHFLYALHVIVGSGQTPADELLARYANDWHGDLGRIYADYSYYAQRRGISRETPAGVGRSSVLAGVALGGTTPCLTIRT
jgi:hypothetical protein